MTEFEEEQAEAEDKRAEEGAMPSDTPEPGPEASSDSPDEAIQAALEDTAEDDAVEAEAETPLESQEGPSTLVPEVDPIEPMDEVEEGGELEAIEEVTEASPLEPGEAKQDEGVVLGTVPQPETEESEDEPPAEEALGQEEAFELIGEEEVEGAAEAPKGAPEEGGIAEGPAEVEEGAEAAELEEPESVEEPDDGRMWYVVHCYSGYENKVRHNLEQRIDTMGMKDRIFDVVVPTEEEMEVKEGKRRTVERRVFPGYILVQMIMDEDSWYVVRNTPGVTGFVGMGNEPTPLRPEEVSQIIKRMEAEAPRIKVTYKIGQKVRIIDGPFNDFIGTVDDIDMDRAKVRVMVSFFGRETPVELDFLQVEKA